MPFQSRLLLLLRLVLLLLLLLFPAASPPPLLLPPRRVLHLRIEIVHPYFWYLRARHVSLGRCRVKPTLAW